MPRALSSCDLSNAKGQAKSKELLNKLSCKQSRKAQHSPLSGVTGDESRVFQWTEVKKSQSYPSPVVVKGYTGIVC